MEFNRIKTEPLSANIGAEVQGVDLTKLDDTTFDQIHKAFLRHQVLFFRDQELTRERHLSFGRRFGELHIHPAAPSPEGYPAIMRIHADAASTANLDQLKAGKRAVAGNFWHSDVSCDPEPPLGSILYLREVPEVGGDTLFSSMYAAYEALSGPMKRLLEELTAVHSGEHIYRARYPNNEVKDRSDYGYRGAGRFPISEHPVLRTHPETKRTALYVNAGFTTRIKELEPDASQAILDFLFKHIQRPEFCCRFRWRKNSIAFWDNRCVQHYAVFDYFPAVRSGDRVTVKGDKPFYKTNLRSREQNAAAE
ncbi:MAG TPA: TauD/TfdA family dioxygenase [Xanthobacteraceae bacterium]|nr:TauD/TfdA family dioxygenase [Xanthobacteraceae bacterium]